MHTDLLTDMAIFAAVVEQNSFSGAANVMQMSKSNVSRRIALLEDRLGMTLLHRTTRSMTLTESGRVYYEHCARLVTEARDADHAIRAMHASPSGVLNVSLPETLGRAYILPLLPEFMKTYPDVRLNLTITSRKIDFRDERVDVAVRKGEIEDESLCAISIGSSTQYFFASPTYLTDAPTLEDPADLDTHPFLASRIYYGPADIEIWHDDELIVKRVTPKLSVKDHEALLRMTLEGLGVALLPAWMTHDHVHNGELAKVLPGFQGPSVDFNIVFQPHRGMAPNLRAFVEFLKAKFRLYRPWEFDEDAENVVRVRR